eukprot:1822982-Rhodomonas_salina.2
MSAMGCAVLSERMWHGYQAMTSVLKRGMWYGYQASAARENFLLQRHPHQHPHAHLLQLRVQRCNPRP